MKNVMSMENLKISKAFKDPKTHLDQSCWILLNDLNEILKIRYNFLNQKILKNNGTPIRKNKLPYPCFWENVEKNLGKLEVPFDILNKENKNSYFENLGNRIIDWFHDFFNDQQAKLNYKYAEWKNKIHGYDMDALDLTFFIDVFDLINVKGITVSNNFKIKTEKWKQSINPLLNADTKPDLVNTITNMIKKTVMEQDRFCLRKRRKAINEIRYCQLGAFSRVSAKLQEQSKRVAEAISSEIDGKKGLRLTEITVELGIVFPPITAKVELKFDVKV